MQLYKGNPQLKHLNVLCERTPPKFKERKDYESYQGKYSYFSDLTCYLGSWGDFWNLPLNNCLETIETYAPLTLNGFDTVPMIDSGHAPLVKNDKLAYRSQFEWAVKKSLSSSWKQKYFKI